MLSRPVSLTPPGRLKERTATDHIVEGSLVFVQRIAGASLVSAEQASLQRTPVATLGLEFVD